MLYDVKQGGHCPGNQGNEGKVRELRKTEESQGILTGSANAKVLSLFRFNLMISVSAKMPKRSHGKFSEVGEKSGKMEARKSGHSVRIRNEAPPRVRNS